MTDRLAEIKRKANREPMGSNDDRRWLIAEVERLKEELAALKAEALKDAQRIATARIELAAIRAEANK